MLADLGLSPKQTMDMDAELLRWLGDCQEAMAFRSSSAGVTALNRAAASALDGLYANSLEAAIKLTCKVDSVAPADLETIETAKRTGRAFTRMKTQPDFSLTAIRLVDRDIGILLSRSPGVEQSTRAASAAHELANAVGALAGWAELAQTRPKEHLDEALRVIQEGARRAERSARALLEESRSRATRPSPASPIRIARITEEAARVLSPIARASGVRIDTMLDSAAQVVAGSSELYLIISNILQNAVECQPMGGSVYVGLSSVEGADGAPRIQLTVDDDGPGVPNDERASVFAPYFTTKPTGTGLGLALVESHVRALGGSVWAEPSPLLGGARFVVELPEKVTVEPRTRRDSGVVVSSAPLLGLKILVVEDDAGLGALFELTLNIHGAEVTLVKGAAEARTAGKHDLALVDIMLPDADGDTLGAELRASKAAGRIILMTGGEVPRGSRSRPEGVLRKPFETDELVSLVMSVSQRSQATG